MTLEFQQKLLKEVSRTVSPDYIRGCSPQELVDLEARLNLRLPDTYKQFLLTMGHQAGALFRGTDIFYRHLAGLRGMAEELLREDETSFELPDDAFVFAVHQGYQFMYFHTLSGTDDDPAIYHYEEGEGMPKKRWSSFSEFVLNSIADHERLLTRKAKD